MYTVPQIPGVSLDVYKQNRLIRPESDGYVGQFFSGFASVLAVIDPCADSSVLTIGVFRDGQDHYVLQKDWLNNPRTEAQQQAHKMYLASRSFAPETKVYGVKVPLRVSERNVQNTVHYPENMLMLAQYYHAGHTNSSPGYVLVWKIALVSQNGEFFLTVQEAYDVMICQTEGSKRKIPRLQGHRQLEQLILANAPENFRAYTSGLDKMPDSPLVNELGKNEGVVERWYAARNMGCIITTEGPARVHWSDVPPRPRLRYLVPDERVNIADLSVPPKNPATDWRKVRKARFKLQASGIEVA